MLWLIPLFLLVAACSPQEKEPNSLRISLNTQPTTLDPRKAGDFVSSTLICMIYDGLTRCLPGGGVEPALAEQVIISKDRKTYTFYLRKAAWSNGEPITAHDFEKSWKQTLSPPSPCGYLFYPIKNVEKYIHGKCSMNEVGIWALDDRTLHIELEEPTPYFYSLTAFPSFLPVPAHFEKNVYSGPFRIEKIVNQSEMILVKNQAYWNQSQISLDQIHISIVPDEMTALQMFEKGELDWLGGSISPLPPDALDNFKDQINYIPNSATTLCTFNTQTAPFNNINLRKAFSLAIDRVEIVEKVTSTGQIPAGTMLPPTLSNQKIQLFDPLLAKTLFDKALIEMQVSPKTLEKLTLYYKPGQTEKRVAQTLQRQWKEVLGITIEIAQLDFKSHAHRLQNRDYQIALATWIAQFDDPISILGRFKDKENLKNYPGWESLEFVNILQEAGQSKQREKALALAEEVFAKELPLTPIYHWSSPSLCGSRIQEVGSTPSGGILFERASIR